MFIFLQIFLKVAEDTGVDAEIPSKEMMCMKHAETVKVENKERKIKQAWRNEREQSR